MTTRKAQSISPGIRVALPVLVCATVLAGCDFDSSSSTKADSWPRTPPEGLRISDRKIEAIIQCYKIITLAQNQNSGTGAKADGIAASLEPARKMIEDRLIGDLTEGFEKMQINEKVDIELQKLLADKPYGSAEILLGAAQYCAGREARGGW